MGPDELDDLLASIRAEGKKDSALALYEGVREDDLVDENVDERILKLLGLDDVFDIDYGTYVTLLKERLAASRSFSKKLSTEEDELLVEEFRKVKGKVGRFRIKKKKITADSLGVTGPVKVSTERFYLTSKAIIPQPALPDGEESEDIKDISKKLDELIKSIIEQDKEEKKKQERERKEKEDKKRRKRESDLENVTKPVQQLLKKVVAPFQSILDRIMKFIKFTFIGFVLDKIFKWFADPKNKKKIQVLGRFLKDWWPTLLGAAALFLTPFGGFVRGIVKLLTKFGPALVRLGLKNKVASMFTGATILAVLKETQVEKQREILAGVTPQQTAETGKTPGIPQLQAETVSRTGLGFSRGGLIPKIPNTLNIRDIAFEGGGGISQDSGLRITGAGPDTQLIAAQPGEIVMSKKAVDKYGANFFLGMNKNAGASGIPKMVNNIQLAQGGGIVGRGLNFLGGLGLPGTGSVMAPNYTGMGYQNKLLGINLNRVNLPQVSGRQFSQSQVQKYNQSPTAPSTVRNWSPYDPVQVSVPKATSSGQGGSFIGNAFRNFGQNIKTIKGAARRQEIIMRQEGYKPNGYVNLRGQQINLGPQSRVMPVGTPTIASRTQMVVLPPITTVAKKPSMRMKTGTQIPDFQIISNTPHRINTANALGISDLVRV